MSYVIAKSIRVNGDKIVITSTSNNISPKYYETWNVDNNEKNIALLAQHLHDGIIQPHNSANGYRWCGIRKMLENSPQDQWATIVGERLNNPIKKKVYVISNEPLFKWVCKIGRTYRLTINENDASKLPYYEAEHLVKWTQPTGLKLTIFEK